MSNNYPNTAQHSHLQDYFEVVKECWDKATARKMIRKVPQMRPNIAQKSVQTLMMSSESSS